jgi:hypothetical protein
MYLTQAKRIMKTVCNIRGWEEGEGKDAPVLN